MHIEDLIEPKIQRGTSFNGLWWLYLVAAPFFLLSSFFSKNLHLPISFNLTNEGNWIGANGEIIPASIYSEYGNVRIAKESASTLFYWNFLEEFIFIASFGLIVFAMKRINNSLLKKQIFNKNNLNWLRLIAIVFLYLFLLHPFLESFISDKAVEHLTHEAISTNHLITRNYAYLICSIFFFSLVLIFKEGQTLKEETDLTI